VADDRFWGTFPIVPTTFRDDGELDEATCNLCRARGRRGHRRRRSQGSAPRRSAAYPLAARRPAPTVAAESRAAHRVASAGGFGRSQHLPAREGSLVEMIGFEEVTA